MSLNFNFPRLENANLNNKRVIVRFDINKVFDSTGALVNPIPILNILPTIKFILSKGSKLILLTSTSDSKNINNKIFEITELKNFLSKELSEEINFVSDFQNKTVKDEIEKTNSKITLFDNLDKNPEEKNEKKNDKEFAKLIASYGDIFVNEARSSNNYNLSTIVNLPTLLPSYLGLGLHGEIEFLKILLEKNKNKSILILGGVDFEKKFEFLKKFLKRFKTVLIGGGLAFTFLDSRAIPIGASLKEQTFGVPAFQLLEKAELELIKIILPIDFITTNNLSNKKSIKATSHIPNDWIATDIGSKTVSLFEKFLTGATNIFWYGSIGMAEINKFDQGTQNLLNMLSKTKLKKFAFGSDTTTSIYKTGKYKNFDFLEADSDFVLNILNEIKMPGLEALSKET